MEYTYEPGSYFDNRYLLKEFKGSGSFGEVWLAVDKQTELEVAIKIYITMDTQGLKNFIEEYKLPFNLNHTNLLHANYLGICQTDNRPYLVMPFCSMGSASRYIGNITEEKLWVFIRDVASGLAYLHSQNPPIIHQDIKPDNILIANNGDFVITDFGISKQVRSTLRKSVMKLDSAGAIAYMGPERFLANYTSIKSSDIWSLGATIYELAEGTLPFSGYGGSFLNHGADMPQLSDGFSDNLNRLMQACLKKEPWDRPIAEELATYANFKVKGITPETPAWMQETEIKEQPPTPPGNPPVLPSNETDETSGDKEKEPDNGKEKEPDSGKKSQNSVLPWVLTVAIGIILGAIARLLI